jgi:hypothetical protein
VAYADIHAGSPVWTIVTAMTDAGVAFQNQAVFATDAGEYSKYYIYVVARGLAGGRQHTYFVRSVNQGNGYEAEYRIADSTPTTQNYTAPRVVYGNGGFVHVTFRSETIGDLANAGVLYMRASSFADAGLAAWGAPQPLVAPAPALNALVHGMSASAADGGVYVLLSTISPLYRHYLHYSTDRGATWPVSNQVELPVGGGRAPLILPGGDLVYPYADAFVGPGGVEHRVVLSRSTSADPSSWTGGESMSSPVSMGAICSACLEGCEANPALGGRVATAWVRETPGEREIRFDAEWRRDPGYPNTDIGFPIPVTGGGQTPPAVAEVDGDPEKEIVFGTVSGDIHVINHDGTEAPGWPVNIGAMPYDAPVAVGDLVGNGEVAIVAGTTSGKVVAFDPQGNELAGWPVDLGTGASVYVSIGALGPPSTRYVVALSARKVAIINPWGDNVAPAWNPPEIPFGTYTRPAAIGDVDEDGITEIVSLAGPNVYYHQLNDPNYIGTHFSGETFSDAPTLADLDGDDDLEVAMPTASGKMYIHNPGELPFPGWPVTVSPGVPLTSAAMAQFLGPPEADLVFGDANGNVYLYWFDGILQAGYPKASGSTIFYMPPILTPVSGAVSGIAVGTTAAGTGTTHSWSNIGLVPAGWPKNMAGPVEETFASGDIDNDGRNEIVVLGVSFLTVLDVGTAPASNAHDHWPMYGYDPQRTGCLACDEILVGVGDTPVVARTNAIEAHPNPFNPSTTIEYEVARAGRVSLEIFDVSGRLVATLVDNEPRDAGRYSVAHTATGASGVYFARLRTVDGDVTGKIVLLK